MHGSGPDIVLMDIQLPGMSGIECVARLKELHPDAQVLMVTVYDNNDRIFEALAAGANGYLLKRDAPDKLIQSLDELLDGGSPMSGAIARKVVQHFRKSPPSQNRDHDLTSRETEILKHLVNGSLYKEIAEDVGIGYETVRTHLRNIYAARKLSVVFSLWLCFRAPQGAVAVRAERIQRIRVRRSTFLFVVLFLALFLFLLRQQTHAFQINVT
jgi:DNA-binding NarL/FixJ family response regulator